MNRVQTNLLHFSPQFVLASKSRAYEHLKKRHVLANHEKSVHLSWVLAHIV